MFESPRYRLTSLERRRAAAERRLEIMKDRPKQAAYALAALERIDRQIEAIDADMDRSLEEE